MAEQKAKSKETSVKMVGCVLQFKGIGTNASREDIKVINYLDVIKFFCCC